MAISAVSESPVEPSTIPAWRFRQEPGGEKQIGPQPRSCMGEQEAERALYLLLAASRVSHTHSPSCLQRTMRHEGPNSKSQHPCCWRGAFFSEALSLARGWAWRWGLLGTRHPFCSLWTSRQEEGKKTPGSGIHVVPEHPRLFTPRQQALLVLHDRWETGAQRNRYRLLEAKVKDWGKDKTSEILI